MPLEGFYPELLAEEVPHLPVRPRCPRTRRLSRLAPRLMLVLLFSLLLTFVATPKLHLCPPGTSHQCPWGCSSQSIDSSRQLKQSSNFILLLNPLPCWSHCVWGLWRCQRGIKSGISLGLTPTGDGFCSLKGLARMSMHSAPQHFFKPAIRWKKRGLFYLYTHYSNCFLYKSRKTPQLVGDFKDEIR